MANPVFVTTATRAMTDMPYNLFLLGALAAMMSYIDANKQYLSVFYCGLFGGLASCVKFVGFPLVGISLLMLVCFSYGLGKVTFKRAVSYLALAAISGFLVIYILTPNYWPSFANFNKSELLSEIHDLAIGGKTIKLEDGTETSVVNVLRQNIFNRKEIRETYPQFSSAILPMCEFFFLPARWNNLYKFLLEKQKKTAPGKLEALEGVFFKYHLFPGAFFLLLGGLLYCAHKTWQGVKNNKLYIETPLLFYFLVYAIFIILTLKMDTERYFLPILVIEAILSGIFVSRVWESCILLWNRVKKIRSKTAMEEA
jgi:4-amino-4-deoxy-L-arabinose transferase-like glycosyltransferase